MFLILKNSRQKPNSNMTVLFSISELFIDEQYVTIGTHMLNIEISLKSLSLLLAGFLLLSGTWVVDKRIHLNVFSNSKSV